MSANDYADYLFFTSFASDSFNQNFGAGWRLEEDAKEFFRVTMRQSFAARGYAVGTEFDSLSEENFDWACKNGVLVMAGDDLTGSFYKLRSTVKVEAVKKFLAMHGVAQTISTLGDLALRRALLHLSQNEGWATTTDDSVGLTTSTAHSDFAPGSDRIVLFSDNQISDLDQKATEVIEHVSAQNQVGETPGLRELVLGQLRAGRELVRAGSVRLFILQVTLIDTLKYLAQRYEKEAIGALASGLIAAMISHLGLSA